MRCQRPRRERTSDDTRRPGSSPLPLASPGCDLTSGSAALKEEAGRHRLALIGAEANSEPQRRDRRRGPKPRSRHRPRWASQSSGKHRGAGLFLLLKRPTRRFSDKGCDRAGLRPRAHSWREQRSFVASAGAARSVFAARGVIAVLYRVRQYRAITRPKGKARGPSRAAVRRLVACAPISSSALRASLCENA